MARITLPKGIASISGKLGNIVFYSRSGKQYARRLDGSNMTDQEFDSECMSHLRALARIG